MPPQSNTQCYFLSNSLPHSPPATTCTLTTPHRNSQCELKLRPLIRNKQLHDTYLRQGEIKVLETGADVYESLDKAVDSLTRKLKKISKPEPKKKDYSARF
jgi:ribosome-associated translation inhibitor RaiA